MARHKRLLTAVLAAATSCLAASVLAVPAPAALAAGTAGAAGAGSHSLAAAAGLPRTETPVTPAVPTSGVTETYVQLHDPLPASDAPHPAACDWIGYLRLRSAAGPADSPDADAVMTLMPGDDAGAALYVNQARLVVQEAAAQGRHVEVWILSRRSNCLVDNTGFQAAAAAHDYHVAIDYYFHGQAIGGKTFAGFLTSADAPVLADLGLAQTVDDWADVIAEGMPDAAMRQHKLYCGGHSLGGPITAAFAGWDFDGTPGYGLCAGFFGEDTLLTTGARAKVDPGVGGAMDIIGSLGVDTVDSLLESGAIDRIQELGPFDPEVLMTIQGVGIQAFYHPAEVSDYGSVTPASLGPALQFYLSQNLAAYLTSNPPATSYQLTNQALLGTLMDDNTDPVSAFKAGLGTYDCPVVQKNFPATDPTLMIPASTSPVCGWVPYNQMASAPVQLNDQGQPFTNASQEVSDIGTLAEVLTDQPVGLTEPYMPTRLVTDVAFMILGNRGGDLANLKYPDGITERPDQTIVGGSGVVVGAGLPLPSDAVVVPGYHHLDVGGLAAATQNNGKPEKVSAALTHFLLTGTPGPG